MSTSTNSIASSGFSSLLSSGALASVGASANNTGLASSLAVSGLASGMNWQATVQALAQAERAPETQWQQQQSTLNTQNSAFTTIKNYLSSLQTDIQTLQDPNFYGGAAAQSSDSTIATAGTSGAAALGSYIFKITQLATAAQVNGSGNISQVLAPNGNVGAVTIGTAGFATAVTAGTFTVNGAQVTIASTDTLQQVFANIAAATNNAVTASYNPGTDKISLSSSSQIVLGSATDTSNFLQVAQMYNNNEVLNSGTYSIGSSAALGRAELNVALSNANLNTAINDGGSGQGQFTINGVSISYNATNDTIQNVLNRINSSAAGVAASYDSLNNRFVLTDKTTGDVGISAQDVPGQGNFLAATGLASGTLQHGQNLLYTINNGTQLVSQSNTITQASSGITGLSVTALNKGQVTISTSSDTSSINSAIQQFITDYNSVQSYINSQQIVTTSSSGTVTPGMLTGDQTANNLASGLRSAVFSAMPGLSGTIKMLADLGIQTNGQDNTLKVADATVLNNALTNNLDSVKSFFSDATNGLATQLNNFLDGAIGDGGTLINHQASLTQQNTNINTQISNLEKKITSDSAHWTSEFQAMELAQSQINQELTYLSQQVANGTL
jgi:flagellar hook-associated protein 2